MLKEKYIFWHGQRLSCCIFIWGCMPISRGQVLCNICQPQGKKGSGIDKENPVRADSIFIFKNREGEF